MDARTLDGATPLHMAARCNQPGCLRRLLAAGAAPDAVDTAGFPPIMLAAQKGPLAAAEALLQAGTPADQLGPEGNTAL